MKDEYDFSNAARGRFHRPPTTLVVPVHLEPDVLAFLSAKADARKVSLTELVNTLLRKDIEAMQALD